MSETERPEQPPGELKQTPEKRKREVEAYGEFSVGQEITWHDEQIQIQFTQPAYGYGNGPFIVEKITINLSSKGELPKTRPYLNSVKLRISTPKGYKDLSADHFKPAT